MWDDEDWRSLVVRVPQEMRDDEADDPQARHSTGHRRRRRRRLQHRSRFREPFGTALHHTARIHRSRCNPRGSVLSSKEKKNVTSILT